MFWAIVLVVLVMWASCCFALHIGGPLIHLLVAVAAVMVIDRLVIGRIVTWSEGRGKRKQDSTDTAMKQSRAITK